MARFFTFEEFRDKIIKPSYDKGMIEHDGATLDEVAEACLILYQREGLLLKEQRDDNMVYIRTSKQLPQGESKQ